MLKLSEVLRQAGATEDEVKDSTSGTVEEYQGKKLDPTIGYTFDANQYENLNECKASKDWPGENEVLKIVNRQLVVSAKAKAYQAATKSLKEAYDKSPEKMRADLIKAALATKYFTQEQAEAMANQAVPL